MNPVTGNPTLITQYGYLVNPTDVALALPPPQPPVSTPGIVSGGGKIDRFTGEPVEDGWIAITGGKNASKGSLASFRFVIRYNRGDAEPSGYLTFEDSDAKVTIESKSYELLLIKNTHASFVGTAVVNGEFKQKFRVDVDDLGPNNTDLVDVRDTFSIQLLDGSYMAFGEVLKGDIQIGPLYCLLRPCIP